MTIGALEKSVSGRRLHPQGLDLTFVRPWFHVLGKVTDAAVKSFSVRVSYQPGWTDGLSHQSDPPGCGKRPATCRARLDEWRVHAVSAFEDLASVSSEILLLGKL